MSELNSNCSSGCVDNIKQENHSSVATPAAWTDADAAGEDQDEVKRLRSMVREQAAAVEELREKLRAAEDELAGAREESAEERSQIRAEMQASLRFSEGEWRRHCDELEARLSHSQRETQALLSLVGTVMSAWEATDRDSICREEAASFSEMYRSHRELLVPLFFDSCFTQREEETDYRDYTRGLHHFWNEHLLNGTVTQEEVAQVLESRAYIRKMPLNVESVRHPWDDAFTLPAADVDGFLRSVVAHLPELEALFLNGLPSLSLLHESPVPLLPPTVTDVSAPLSSFTVSDLRSVKVKYPALEQLTVSETACTDWDHLQAGDSDRQSRLSNAVGLRISFY